MNNEKATYISELIFSQLASFHSIQLPGIGCLRCILINASKDKQTNALTPPRYVIEFYCDGNDKSIVDTLSDSSGITPQEAQELYEEWKNLVCVISESGELYEIPKVGTLTLSQTNPALFVPAKELEPFTNPFGNRKEEVILVPEIITKPISERKIDKRRSTRRAMIALLIAAIGILSFVLVQIYSYRSHKTEHATTTVIVSSVKQTPIDTIQCESPADTTTAIEPIAIAEEPNKPFHVIAGTFADSTKAERLFLRLKEEGNEGASRFKTHNSVSPYFVSIASFVTQEEATHYINNTDPGNEKEFWVYKKSQD